MRLLRALWSKLRGTTTTTPRLKSPVLGYLESIETTSSGFVVKMRPTEEFRDWWQSNNMSEKTVIKPFSIWTPPENTSTTKLHLTWRHDHGTQRSDAHDLRDGRHDSEESEVDQTRTADQALGIEEAVQQDSSEGKGPESTSITQT